MNGIESLESGGDRAKKIQSILASQKGFLILNFSC